MTTPAAAPAAAVSPAQKRWFPIESNPDVMNAYVERLGFPTEMFK